ncbi:hypothetical protein [Lactobacillus acetotolerans]|uniref:hypothetical protein n=1 Tax=Lactobacillus acetotolerans TaxID=1600 RepID=UPI002FDB3F77
MPTINGKACVIDGTPVDKVFSNGVQVYGRNLISGSYDSSWSFYSLNNATVDKVTMDSGEVALHVIGTSSVSGFYAVFNLPANVSYTASVEVKGTGKVNTLGWQNWEAPEQMPGMTPTSNWQRVSRTVSSDSKLPSFIFYGTMDVYVKLMKVEKGTIATPWTPAPEDVM